MLRAKIHMATVTESNLNYEGSITVDRGILEKAGILPHEQVHVTNLNNGERFETYVIPGKKGEICLNGPTARKGSKGDRVIIFSYGWTEEKDIGSFAPKIIKLDGQNRIKRPK